MDDTGIHGSASQADNNQTGQGGVPAERKHQCKDAKSDDAQPQTYHLRIVQLYRNESGDSPSCGNSDKEHACETGCRFRGNPFIESKIAAGPEPCSLLYCAVAEKAQHHFLYSADRQDLLQ